MPWYHLIWDDDPIDGNVAHLAEHGVTPSEFEDVLQNSPQKPEMSRFNPRHLILNGRTRAGRELKIVYEQVDTITVYPITAYDRP